MSLINKHYNENCARWLCSLSEKSRGNFFKNACENEYGQRTDPTGHVYGYCSLPPESIIKHKDVKYENWFDYAIDNVCVSLIPEYLSLYSFIFLFEERFKEDYEKYCKLLKED